MNHRKLTASCRFTGQPMSSLMGNAWIASKRYHVRPCKVAAAVGREV